MFASIIVYQGLLVLGATVIPNGSLPLTTLPSVMVMPSPTSLIWAMLPLVVWVNQTTSRVHLDLYTSEQEGEVERLLEIGATRYPQKYRPDADFVVLEDPDGNRFCVVQVPDGS